MITTDPVNWNLWISICWNWNMLSSNQVTIMEIEVLKRREKSSVARWSKANECYVIGWHVIKNQQTQLPFSQIFCFLVGEMQTKGKKSEHDWNDFCRSKNLNDWKWFPMWNIFQDSLFLKKSLDCWFIMCSFLLYSKVNQLYTSKGFFKSRW